MAYLHRLIFVLLVGLSAWLPSTSFASFPAPTVQTYKWQYWGSVCNYLNNSSTVGATAACQGLAAKNVWNTDIRNLVATDSNCSFTTYSPDAQYSCTENAGGSKTSTGTAQQCPANSTGTTTCTCNSGFVEDATHTSCVAAAVQNCANVTGQMAGSFNSPYVSGASLNATLTNLCDAGSAITGGSKCMIAVTYDFATPNGTSWIKQGSGTFTGEPCVDGQEVPVPQPPASSPTVAPTINPCKAGGVPGTVNGLAVCSPASDRNVVMAGPTSTASAPAGSASAPTSGLGASAPPTAVKSTEQTACTGGTCTTTKTFTDSSGAVVGTSAVSLGQGAFCAENPKTPTCGGKDGTGSFSGSCGAPPACSGDAVLCAVAAATFATNCSLNPSTSTEADLYGAKKGLTGKQTGELPGNDTKTISSGDFSTAELLGAAGGMSDLTVTVFRSNITLPFSSINVWLERLGQIMQAVTFLLCLRIVSRG